MPALPPASLLAEGRAMLTALAADFLALGHVSVDVLGDPVTPLELPGCTVHPNVTPEQGRSAISSLSADADWTVIVAPEFGGILYERCRAVEASGGRLLGPSSRIVALTADKQ